MAHPTIFHLLSKLQRVLFGVHRRVLARRVFSGEWALFKLKFNASVGATPLKLPCRHGFIFFATTPLTTHQLSPRQRTSLVTMAQATLSQEDIKALEQTRQRIFQLTKNIESLKGDVLRSNPLPQWSSLQTSASILASNIESLTSHMSKHSDLLNRTVVYPSTNYPGRTQEGVLTQLLRKKMEPQVETWVEEGRATQGEIKDGGINERDEDELLDWAKDWIGGRVAKYAMEEAGDDYTVEERALGVENVNTGLKMKDESDSEDEEMEDVGLAVVAVKKDSAGQVGFGLGELKRDGKVRVGDDTMRFGLGVVGR